MIKIGNIIDLNGIKLDSEVIEVIKIQLRTLDDCYKANRDIEKDLGEYVLILQDENDVIIVKGNIVKDIIPEYINDIECEGGKQYCLALFLLSSDYAVVVVAAKALMDILIEG